MLAQLGANIAIDGLEITLNAPSNFVARDILVPSDISSAAFFIVGCLLNDDMSIRIPNVAISPERDGLLRVLKRMGAPLDISEASEPGSIVDMGDVVVGSGALQAVDVDGTDVPDMIDEFPIFMVACLRASGRSIVTGAEELRVKESDRIQAMVDGFANVGLAIESAPDGFSIVGDSRSVIDGGIVNSQHDHRIAMSFAIASLVASNPIEINGAGSIATSFPNFVELAEQIGIECTI